MNNFTTKSLIAALALMSHVRAGIQTDGIWTGVDYYKESAKIGIKNGVPYSKDSDMTRRINSAMTVDGNAEDYRSKENVKRVMRLVTEDDWEYLFPMRSKELYEYEGFLHAVGKYEAFCGETGLEGYTLDQSCARELSTLFAHFGQETGLHDSNHEDIEEWRQALYWVTEIKCTEGLSDKAGTQACDYKDNGWAGQAYPPQPDVQYYGRGPFQLSWNYNYGAFSKVFRPASYDGTMYLLKYPDEVATDAYTVFTSALWFYMTPQYPKPSQHDVMAGFMVPTEGDKKAGIGATFGTTVNIINGGIECRQGQEKAQVLNRIKYYKAFLNHFNLPEEDESGMGCANHGFWPQDGYGAAFAYFTGGWENVNGPHCTPVKWQTPYNVYTRDDYKRCVCDTAGAGADDCKFEGTQESEESEQEESQETQQEEESEETQQEESEETEEESEETEQEESEETEQEESEETEQEESENKESEEEEEDKSEDDKSEEEKNDDEEDQPIIISDVEKAFNDIWADPHYSETERSHTNYQVDRSLDYIEKKMAEIQALFELHNFIQ